MSEAKQRREGCDAATVCGPVPALQRCCTASLFRVFPHPPLPPAQRQRSLSLAKHPALANGAVVAREFELRRRNPVKASDLLQLHNGSSVQQRRVSGPCLRHTSCERQLYHPNGCAGIFSCWRDGVGCFHVPFQSRNSIPLSRMQMPHVPKEASLQRRWIHFNVRQRQQRNPSGA